jgi:hypothetical protein
MGKVRREFGLFGSLGWRFGLLLRCNHLWICKDGKSDLRCLFVPLVVNDLIREDIHHKLIRCETIGHQAVQVFIIFLVEILQRLTRLRHGDGVLLTVLEATD